MEFDHKNKYSIQTLFNQIAPKYDLINEFMSFGCQKSVKISSVKNALKELRYTPKNALDLCCGTGDISVIIKKLCPKCETIGVDFSEEMLSIAKQKSKEITFINHDITDLKNCQELSENKFDLCFISFGLRNLPNIDEFLTYIKSFLNEDGVLVILDLGKPNPLLIPYFTFHYEILIPIIAKIFNREISPYKYFTQSSKRYPSQKEILKKLSQNGYIQAKNKNFFFGILATQTAKYSPAGE